MQLPEVVEDVGPEPRLAGRRLALEGERPCLERCALCDELGGLEQLVLVRVARLEDARRQRVRREDDVRVRAAHALGEEVDEARLVVPALDERELGAAAERVFELLPVAGDRHRE